MNWKECKRKWSWPNLKYHTGIFLNGPRKTTKDLSYGLQGRNVNPGPTEYEAGVLTTGHRCSELDQYKNDIRTEQTVSWENFKLLGYLFINIYFSHGVGRGGAGWGAAK
jgi:hypothetical protein